MGLLPSDVQDEEDCRFSPVRQINVPNGQLGGSQHPERYNLKRSDDFEPVEHG
jgi:hypothetical protein